MGSSVLVVDDDEASRKVAKMLLERLGHAASEARNAAEAREALQEEKSIELVLCDIRMPGESGIDLARFILENHRDIAVIMVTVEEDPKLSDAALEYGAYGYVIKPFRLSELAINVDNALRRRRLEIETRRYAGKLEELVLERTAELEQALEDLRAASVAREEFVANSSHELRTPLTPIIGWANLLARDTSISQQAREAAETIEAQAERLMKVVDSLLLVHSLHDQRAGALGGVADLAAELRAAGQLAEKHGRPVTIEAPEVAEVAAGADKLREVLTRLVDNAVKFTPEGTPVALTARTDVDDTVVSVVDSGPGILEADRERVFGSFVQGDGSATRRHGGLGLGLYISRELIGRYGGRIWIEDTPGGGATLTFTLPNRWRS